MKINYFGHELDVPGWVNWVFMLECGSIIVSEFEPTFNIESGKKEYFSISRRGQAIKLCSKIETMAVRWQDSLVRVEGECIEQEPEQLTMRDHFAMSALSGLLSDSNLQGSENDFVKYAYIYADLMIEARKRC